MKNKIYAGIAVCLCALLLTGCTTNENTSEDDSLSNYVLETFIIQNILF